MGRFIKLRSILCLALVLGLSFGFFLNDVSAVQPNTINYQGRLYDLANAPLSGQYDFQFRLYDDVLKTTLLWGPEEFTNQSVVNGYFAVPLGSIESFSVAGLDFTDQYYLTIQIKETAAGIWDTEADPPVPFNSYAYSLNTQKLDNADGFVDIGLGILAGYQLAGAETAFAINTAVGFTGDLLSLSNNSTNYLRVDHAGDIYLTDTQTINMTNNSVNNLIGMKITNTNDVDNYAGSVLELKGSGADYTNNVYFGKYGDGFWVPSWAGNGVLATDKNLVIAAVDASSRVSFQVGGGYTTPSTVAYFDTKGLNMLPYDVASGATGKIKFFELAANGGDAIELRAPDDITASFSLTFPADDGGAGEVLQTNGSGILSWGAGGSGGEVSTMDLSAASYNGSFVSGGKIGYDAANEICELEYPGSHFCLTNDIITIIRTGDISSWTGTAWIAEGPPGFTSNSNDCNGWTSSVVTTLGAFWEFSSSGGGMGWLTNCGSSKRIACCQ